MSDFLHYLGDGQLWWGVPVAAEIAAVAMLGALILGLLLALMRESKLRVIRWPAAVYVWLMRGTPLLLQLLFFYDVLPEIGLKLAAIPTAMVGFALNEAAFSGEIIRGGIRSVNRNQLIAADSLGMGRVLTLRRVVLPQAMRAIVPALSNDAISLFKATSLASVISVNELTLRATQIMSQNLEFFQVFGAAGVIYLVTTSVLSIGQSVLERHFALERPTGQVDRMFGVSRLRIPGLRGRTRPETGTPHNDVLPTTAAVIPAGVGALESLVGSQVAPSSGTAPFVVLRAVAKTYGGRPVLRSVDLSVLPGEVVVIMGRSGSGKSTLLRLVNHLESVDGGEILVDGEHVGYREVRGVLEPTDHLARARADARIGMVFQHFNLFDHLPVIENVTLAPRYVYGQARSAAESTAQSLLAGVGLSQHTQHLPHRLSGGQQQRVAIARALAISPKLMLFDEPTSALDPELVGEVLSVIRRLASAGMTMLVVTHEVRFAREVADRVVFMDDGRIVEEGPPTQLLDNPTDPRTRQFLNLVERNVATA